MVRRKPTSTSAFGVGRRENHDSSGFYSRFTPPVLSTDDDVNRPSVQNEIFVGDARYDIAGKVDDASVALVVTSPPYFAGKEYEEAMGQGHVPASYFDYLDMLHDVFAECVPKLEPGGRIAVNVANLGRRPYRSLAADVIGILQDRLGLLLRGEVVWKKAAGATGSCAWGSFQSPANPVLRDLTERVVIASKGRFDRAKTARQRHEQNLPSEASIFKDEFMEATTDVWDIAPESATRVGHPAPFPVELPQRIIDLFTYRGDLVLDPFMGSGTTAVAAVRTERLFLGFDTDDGYVEQARERVADERRRLEMESAMAGARPRVVLPAVAPAAVDGEDFQARAVREGLAARKLAQLLLEECGFTDIEVNCKVGGGVEVNFRARDSKGGMWYFDVSGAFTSTRAGLRRTDTLWKALGKAAILREMNRSIPLVLLTTDLPSSRSAGGLALAQARPGLVFDVIEMTSPEAQARLEKYALSGRRPNTRH